VVATMAPWAVAQGRAVALAGAVNPVWVRGNAPAISDALRNLVENAVLYSDSGDEVEIGVAAEGTISVADRGPGIPVAEREHAFDRFWRGKRSGVEGAGLGLSIAREIMMMHGGSVRITDNPGGGTIVVLSFPRVAAEDDAVGFPSSSDLSVATASRPEAQKSDQPSAMPADHV